MIKGIYRFKQDGKVIAEKENILTANGLKYINLYLSNSVPEWAGTLVIGALSTTAASTDTRLGYQFGSSLVTNKTFYSGSQIVLQSSLDLGITASVFEIGIVPSTIPNTKDSYVITKFDELYGSSASSDWGVGSSISTASANNYFTAGNSIVGQYNLALSTSSVATRNDFALDVSGYTANDYLSLLYYVPKTGVSATSGTALFVFTDSYGSSWSTSSAVVSTAASGYYSASFQLNSFPTGFDSSNVNIVTASFSGGTGSVSLDALKFMDGSALTPPYQLISRASSTTPLVVLNSSSQKVQVEYSIVVT